MRYAILSDIHSNLEAFEAVINACKGDGIRRYFCLGDILGYGASPNECLSLFKELKMISVAGNHDWAVAGRLEPDDLNDEAKEVVAWTKKNILPEWIEALKNFPLTYKNEDMILVHSTLNYPEKFFYMSDPQQSHDTFYLMDRKVCFVGHTHIPQNFFRKNNIVSLSKSLVFHFEDDASYIVNVGSVGQPRDGNPWASYGVFDPDLKRIEIKRVPYDVKKSQQKIIASGLPEFLANRLSIGQ